MKLAITIEVDVDIVVWGDEYDVRGVPAIKADVSSYVASAIACSNAAENDAITEVRVSKVTERKSI